VERQYNIGKKWRGVFSYTLWMFEYYVRRTKNELDLDDVDALLLIGLKNTYISLPEKIKLNNDQMKFFLVMVDYVNNKLLDELEPPFQESEMEYFRNSTKFMERFNKFDNIYKEWAESRLELVELIK
jgi:hypothetical protein